jgi:hypothetical protein
VGAVLNVAAAPLALVFFPFLLLFMSLKSDLATLTKGQKDLGKQTDDLMSSQTVIIGLLSLLTVFSAFAAPK